MKGLIIGAGQIGQALHKVISEAHETSICDIEGIDGTYEIIHVCYPDHPDFVTTTEAYIKKHKPKYTVIHSSVEVGTMDKIKYPVVYSPVRGRHPKLETDLLLYAKFIFSPNILTNAIVANYFKKCGLKTTWSIDMRSGEFLKLISNVHMGLEIAWRQEVERMLKSLKIDRGLYDIWEKTYQDGYIASNDLHLSRPTMKPDPIGGHCILPCTEIIRRSFDSPLFDFILDSNERAKKGL